MTTYEQQYNTIPATYSNSQAAPSKMRTNSSASTQKVGWMGKLEGAVSSITNTTMNMAGKAGTQIDYFVKGNITKDSQHRWWSFNLQDTLLGGNVFLFFT